MALFLRYAVRSDLGLVRNNNEDSVYAGPRLLAIADGMGGHAAGEVASKIVIGTLEPLDEDRRIDDLMGISRTCRKPGTISGSTGTSFRPRAAGGTGRTCGTATSTARGDFASASRGANRLIARPRARMRKGAPLARSPPIAST